MARATRAEVDDRRWSGSTAPRCPAACGSISRRLLRADAPRARARRWRRPARPSVSSRGSSPSSSATTSLPQRSNGMPRSAAKCLELRLAVAAQARLERTRRVVEAGVERRRCCGPSGGPRPGSRLDHGEAQIRRAPQQLERGGETDDPAADHQTSARSTVTWPCPVDGRCDGVARSPIPRWRR